MRDTARRQIQELERKMEAAASQKQAQSSSPDPGTMAPLQEAIGKLESSLKAAENEKIQLGERLANEQKRVSIYESKYATLFKEIGNKDKEIMDLKATLAKLQKEANLSASKDPAQAQDAGQSKLLKEAEARENALKQEVKKLAFKQEQHEKNVKAIQAEAAEKAKLMEQKLQSAKTREIELLKKIDDLSAALKKASKAA